MDKNSIDSDLVRKLAALLEETGLSEIEIEQDDFKIRLKRPGTEVQTVVAAPSAGAAPAPGTAAPAAEATVDAKHPGAVLSPMVGNAYLAPRPGADPFVKVGDRVEQGQTVLIVEAMKVMNPIPAHKGGVLKALEVTDGQPVEFNDVLAIIE